MNNAVLGKKMIITGAITLALLTGCAKQPDVYADPDKPASEQHDIYASNIDEASSESSTPEDNQDKKKSPVRDTYTYKDRKTTDNLTSFYITKTIYYPTKVVVYWGGEMEADNMEGFNYDNVEVKSNRIIIYSDDPRSVTSFRFKDSCGWRDFEVRYLDSDNYSLVETDYDTAGGAHISGDVDTFQTEEEKAASKKRAEEALKEKARQEQIFDQYLGTWVSKGGSEIVFYIDEDGQRRVSIPDVELDKFVGISDGRYGDYMYELTLDAYTCGMVFGVQFSCDGEKMWTNQTGDVYFYKQTDGFDFKSGHNPEDE